MPKHNKKFKFKAHKYIALSSTMPELDKANKMELSLRAYQSLSLHSKDITYQEFKHITSCRIPLKPLELQYNLHIDRNTRYLVKWLEIGYLFNFLDWSSYPQNQPFIGPEEKSYKITPKPEDHIDNDQKDLT